MKSMGYGSRLALVAVIALATTACGSLERLRALRVVKDAHTQYQRGDYERAVELYGEVLANDPDMVDVYFYLGNSYDQLYRPSQRGEPENDQMLELAIDNYITAHDRQPNPILRTLAMQYLIAAFGPDKANEPGKSEPVLRQLIAEDPENPDTYFQLAQRYEDSGLYDESEEILLQVLDMRSDDSAVHMQMAGFYDRNENFEKTIESLKARAAIESDNPEAFYTIGTFYWQKAFRDFRLSDDEEMEYVMLGLVELEKALAINPDYGEAITYKNILMRLQANLTDDLDEREALIEEADALRDRAEQLLEQQRSGVAG